MHRNKSICLIDIDIFYHDQPKIRLPKQFYRGSPAPASLILLYIYSIIIIIAESHERVQRAELETLQALIQHRTYFLYFFKERVQENAKTTDGDARRYSNVVYLSMIQTYCRFDTKYYKPAPSRHI